MGVNLATKKRVEAAFEAARPQASWDERLKAVYAAAYTTLTEAQKELLTDCHLALDDKQLEFTPSQAECWKQWGEALDRAAKEQKFVVSVSPIEWRL